MPYTTVVAGTTITAAWGNANVRDQVVTPFASAAARTSAITSPIAGMASYITTTKALECYDGTVWGLSQSNYVGSASRTASVTATTTETLCDSVTFTAVAGRRYKLSWSGTTYSSTAGDNYDVRTRYAAGASVTSAGTQIHGVTILNVPVNNGIPTSFAVHTVALPAGQVTVGVFIVRTFGGGTINSSATAPSPTVTIVEDIGT
jgi:hypothetical protein